MYMECTLNAHCNFSSYLFLFLSIGTPSFGSLRLVYYLHDPRTRQSGIFSPISFVLSLAPLPLLLSPTTECMWFGKTPRSHTVFEEFYIGVLATPIENTSNTVWDLCVLPNHIRALSLSPHHPIMFSQISLWVGVSVFAHTHPHRYLRNDDGVVGPK